MNKKMISLLLAACMMATLMPQTYATSDIGCEKFFCPGEISLALEGTPYAATPDRQLNQLESITMLAAVMGWKVIDNRLDIELDMACMGLQANTGTKEITVTSSPESRKRPITMRQFIQAHKQLADRADKAPQLLYISADGATITSRLLGTDFLTVEEAAALTESIDKPLTAGMAALISARLQRYYSYLYDTDYAELFKILLPEYKDILQIVGKDTLNFWIEEKEDPENHEFNFGSTVHEMTHEYAARQGHVFSARKKYSPEEKSVWWGMVLYSDTPTTFFTGRSVIKAPKLPLSPMSIIKENIPQELKDFAIYNLYLSGKYLHQTYTVYDALQEYTANITQQTATIRQGELKGWTAGYDSYVLAWSYYIQSYFLELQDKYPAQWRRLLEEGTIPQVFCEASALAQQQTDLLISIFGNDVAKSYFDKMFLSELAGDQFVSVRTELEAAAAVRRGTSEEGN